MHNDPAVWILVLNYCSLDDTLACVDEIRKIRYSNKKLLVIDNASPDGSGAELTRSVPASEFIQLPRNTGYAGGNNVGIKLALGHGADFVFIVNPDIRLPPDCIDAYLKTFSSDVKIGALNSIQVQSDGASVDPKFGQTMLSPFGYAGPGFKVGDLPALWESKTLLGAALMIRASCLEQVGGFDPLYFAYGEEEDLCRRLRHHGFRLMVQRDPVVLHLRTKEGSAVSDRVLFLRLKGSYLYRIKNIGGAFHKNLLKALVELAYALVGRNPAGYPYDRFPIRRKHVAATFIWLLTHAWQAYRHRRGEFIGRMHVYVTLADKPSIGPAPPPSEKIRVLFVSHDSGLYGAQLSLLGLLSGLDRKRFDPYVVSANEGALLDRLRDLDVPFTVCPLTHWISPRKAAGIRQLKMAIRNLSGWKARMSSLARIIERLDIDVVYTNTVTCIDGALAARATGRRHLWHLREHVAGNRDLYSIVPSWLVTRIVAMLSDTVVVNSRALGQAYGSGTLLNKLTVAYNGLPLDRFRKIPEAKAAIRRELGLSPDTGLVVLIGSLTPRKGLLAFIDAARIVKQSFPDVAFAVVGGAGTRPYVQSVEERLRETGLAKDFHFLGWRSDIASILSAAEVLAVPAEQEAFGRTLVEAMAAEIPVVATRSGGPEEIVADGETGFLVPVGDSAAMAQGLLSILGGPRLAAQLGVAGRRRAEQMFSVETYVENLQNLIAQTVDSKK